MFCCPLSPALSHDMDMELTGETRSFDYAQEDKFVEKGMDSGTFDIQSIHSLSEVPCTLLRKYYSFRCGLSLRQNDKVCFTVPDYPPHPALPPVRAQ
jgi:hypothetical protein